MEKSPTISYRIDWVSASSKLLNPEELLPSWGKLGTHKPLSKGFYNYQYNIDPVGRLLVSDDHMQGSLLHVTGQDITELINLYGDLSPVTEIMADGRFRTSRLDFALDVIGFSALVRDVKENWEAGKCKTRVRTKPKEIDEWGDGGGNGVYIGSRGKKVERRMRIYDKAAELGILSDIMRIELVTLKDAARRMETDMFLHGILEAGKAHVRDFFDMPECDWWSAATCSGKDFEITRGERSEPNPLVFLFDIVIPMIQNNMYSHPSIIKRFHRHVGRIISEYEEFAHSDTGT